jgi:glutamate synthase (NADH)
MGSIAEKPRITEIEIDEFQEEYTPYKPEKGYGWGDALPEKQGLYDPSLEKDACGVGFAANIKGKASHKIVSDGESI